MAWDLRGQLRLTPGPAPGELQDLGCGRTHPLLQPPSRRVARSSVTPDGVSCPSAAQPALTGVKWVSLQPASAG